MTEIYSTMPTRDVERDWVLGLLLFGSDYSRTYAQLYAEHDKHWNDEINDEKYNLIKENMPSNDGQIMQNVPYSIVAPDVLAEHTDSTGRIWKAMECYESHSRNTTLIRYIGYSVDVYGYAYVSLIASASSSMHDSDICRAWMNGEVDTVQILEWLDS